MSVAACITCWSARCTWSPAFPVPRPPIWPRLHTAAEMAAVAPVLFPEMKARGAKPGDLVALLAATGAQTETIPPSLVLITIGSGAGGLISAAFTGAPRPGVGVA